MSKDQAESRIARSKLTAGSHDAALAAAIFRSDFASFGRFCFDILTPATPLIMSWHIHALAHVLEQVRLGNITRLIINLPPRSLKSTMSGVAFPAYVLGHDPTKRIISVSYSADLSVKHSNDFRSVTTSQRYRKLFPGMRVSATKNTESEVLTTQNGFRLATSVDGTLTGRGGDIIIIDDPLKPADALSDTKRDRTNRWYFDTVLSRLDDPLNGAIIIVMQRLHMEDLTGTLLRNSDEWALLSLPAIAERNERIQIGPSEFHDRRAGEALQPERLPLSMLETIRTQIGSDTFAAQYQQSPAPPFGAMIKRNWLRRYDQLPAGSTSTHIIQSWDTASVEGANNDWSVCTTWLIEKEKYYLADVSRGRFDYPSLKARAIAQAKLHKPHRILVEDSGVGTALAQELKAQNLPAIAVKPEGNKATRMSVQSGKFESGLVLLPKSAPWLADLETELLAFPYGRHDDQVDSISQALGQELSFYDAAAVAAGMERLLFGLQMARIR